MARPTQSRVENGSGGVSRRDKLIAYLEMLLGGGVSGETLRRNRRLSDYLWERADDERMIQRGPDGRLRWGWRGPDGRIRLWQRPRDKEVVLSGYNPERYDHAVRSRAYDVLRREGLEGLKRPENRELYKALFEGQDSITRPAFTAADALFDSGVKVRFVDPFSPGTGEELSRIGKDKNVGAVLQVGHNFFPKEMTRAKDRGKYVTRLVTDYGDGAWRQPLKVWQESPGVGGFTNGMAIRPGVDLYDTVYVPGGDVKKWDAIPRGQHTVSLQGLATSPFFGEHTFAASEPGYVRPDKAKAFLQSGGGSGSGLLFEGGRILPVDGKQRYTSLLSDEKNLFDHLLNALRRKYGDKFTLDYVTGFRDFEVDNMLKGITPEKILQLASDTSGGLKSTDTDLSIIRSLLDRNSGLRKGLMETEKGRDFLGKFDTRYRGLSIKNRVTPEQMLDYYRTSDHLIGLSGSSVSEMSSIKGDTHGGIIHLIPNEAPHRARHFRGNAEVTNRIMQPGARHNIVDINGKNVAEKLVAAIEEGGTKNWGRVHDWKAGPKAMKPLVSDIMKHVRWSPKIMLKHMGKSGLVAGGLALLGHGMSKRFGGSPTTGGGAAIEKKSSAGLQSAYRRGFMRKCAELKVDDRLSNALCIGALLRRSRMRSASSLT